MKTTCRGCGKLNTAKMGEYKDQKQLMRDRTITVRNVEVRSCGCQCYWNLGPMLRLLETHPRKRVVTWRHKARRWS